jgi:hypothetical protein
MDHLVEGQGGFGDHDVVAPAFQQVDVAEARRCVERDDRLVGGVPRDQMNRFLGIWGQFVWRGLLRSG